MTRIFKIQWVALWFLLITVSPGWGVEVGGPLPDFAVRTFAGKTLSRASLTGRPLLLVFWNTWCPDCMRELPKINRLAERFGPRGLVVLAVNTGLNDSERKARAYWKKSGYVFPTGYDHTFEIGKIFAVPGVPTIFLVDAKGVVRYKQSRLPGDVEERLRELIGSAMK